jgi:hypothetical protein
LGFRQTYYDEGDTGHDYKKDKLGMLFVMAGFYYTMEKAGKGRLVLSITETELPVFTYPSITFCYKFKPSKNVIDVLSLISMERWKESGAFLCVYVYLRVS